MCRVLVLVPLVDVVVWGMIIVWHVVVVVLVVASVSHVPEEADGASRHPPSLWVGSDNPCCGVGCERKRNWGAFVAHAATTVLPLVEIMMP